MGKGLVFIANCSLSYKFYRCVGLGVDDEKIMLDDLYSYLEEGNIDSARNILSKPVRNQFLRIENGVEVDGFHLFWDLEVDEFKILKDSYVRRGGKTSEINKYVCRLRKKGWFKPNADNSKSDVRMQVCSYDTFSFHRKKSETPYKWEIKSFNFKKCPIFYEKTCESHEFKK